MSDQEQQDDLVVLTAVQARAMKGMGIGLKNFKFFEPRDLEVEKKAVFMK